MFSTLTLSIITLSYLGLLFVLAVYVEKRARVRGGFTNSPWVYALSLAVFFTSWTFYGSVGFAINNGLQFFAIYVGAIAGLIFGAKALKRMILAKQNLRLTSVADLISTRYRRSQRIAALVTLACLIGLMPYIVLQLRAIGSAVDLLTPSTETIGWSLDGVLITLMMALITIIFGVRRLDPTERHEGIIAVLVAECLVKLFALLALGAYVTYGVFDGFSDILRQLDQAGLQQVYSFGSEGAGYSWVALILLGAAAIVLLPRQFHVTVVENSNPEHLSTAVGLFPFYTILINLFVIPLAGAGLLLGLPAEQGDQFVLLIPQLLNSPALTLIAYIGGFAAATGMIIVTTLTLATMASNHLVIPIWRRLRPGTNLASSLLEIRWALVVLILMLSYGFAASLHASYILVALGLISFAAILQLVPAGLVGLFWRGGNSLGAALGLLVGYGLWAFTLVIPAMVREGWIDASLMTDGLFGQFWLRPEALFGYEGLPSLAHSVFWSLGFNLLFYIVGSLAYRPHKMERSLRVELFDTMEKGESTVFRHARPTGLESYILREPKMVEVEQLLKRYLTGDKADLMLQSVCEDLQLGSKSTLTIIELMELHRMIEQRLAGSIGAASAHSAIEEAIDYSEREAADLRSLFSHLASELNASVIENDSDGEGIDMLARLQESNEEQTQKLKSLQRRVEQLEETVDRQYKEIFDYRMTAQRLQVEREDLIKKLDRRGKPTE
jgi:Na+/proline symporter